MISSLHKLSIFLLSLLIFNSFPASPQNIILNPGFENYGNLPCSWIISSTDFSQAMDDWIMPTAGSTDVFSTLVPVACYANCFSTHVDAVGHQAPHGGDVISAILTYGAGCGFLPDYREYLETHLISALVPGNAYEVKFFVSLGDYCTESSNNFGVYFSMTSISSNLCTQLNVTPQVNFLDIITDTTNWVELTDTIVAASAFQYMTIGNFYDNANTQHISFPGTSVNARYFIDDISVSEISAQQPVTSFISDTAICEKLCIDFFDLSSGNPASWQWLFPGATPDNSTDMNPSGICYNSSGSFDVTLITCNAIGCDTLTLANYITAFPAPALPILTQSNDTLYSSTAQSYQWYTGGNIIPGATDFYYLPSQEDYYTVVVTDSNGCAAADTIFFTLGPISGFAASDLDICEKFCIDFSDQSTNNPLTWQWLFPGGTPASSSSQNPSNVCYTTPGIYEVTLITSNTLGTDTLIIPDYITVYETPPFPTIIQNGNTLTSSVASAYQWQFNSIDISGATNQSYIVDQAGFYTVIVTDSNGCNNSTTLYAEVTGTEDLLSATDFHIYPNPSDGNFICELRKDLKDESIMISVMNALGEKVYDVNEKIYSQGYKKEMNLAYLPSGVYHVEIKMSSVVIKKKITISR